MFVDNRPQRIIITLQISIIFLDLLSYITKKIIKNNLAFFMKFAVISIFLASQPTTPAYAENVDAVPPAFNYQTEWAKNDKYQILNITFLPQDNQYTYAPLQADVYPTVLSFTPSALSSKKTVAQDILILYPTGEKKADPLNKTVKVNVYDETFNLFLLFPHSFEIEGNLTFSFLACSDARCMPSKIEIPLHTPNGQNFQTLNDVSWENEFTTLYQAHSNQDLSKVITTQLEINTEEEQINFSVIPSTDATALDLYNLSDLQSKINKQEVLSPPVFNFEPQTLDNSFSVASLWSAILFGIIAGFILNFMPCVLPVIALKVNVFFKNGQVNKETIDEFREYNAFFAFGILVWFLALGILLGTLGFTWGQLFQSSALVLGLAIFIFAMALSLFNVYHLPVLNIKNNTDSTLQLSKKQKRISAFSTGLLATLLATPCSGPLLGAVLGYSLTQSLPVQLAIFIAMGVGMALPYIVFSICPKLSRFMPRAGNWMIYMEQILGFFLLATSLYLLSILPNDWLVSSLCLALSTSIALYIWGKWGSFHSQGFKKLSISILCLMISLTPLLSFIESEEASVQWTSYEHSNFPQNLGNEFMLLNFSADWCPTCKVLEHTVLTQENLRTIKDTYNPQLIYVDITEFNQEKQNLMQALNTVSIPLLAIFPKGKNSEKPIIIRDIFTYDDLVQALEKAKQS